MSSTQETQLSSWLKALSHPTRLRTFFLLAECGEMRVSELIEHIDGMNHRNQSSLSQHLSVMRRDRVVETRREKQFIYYRINEDQRYQMLQMLKAT